MENIYATEIRIRFYDEDVDIKDLFNKIQNLRAKDYLELYQMMYQDLIENQQLKYYAINDEMNKLEGEEIK